MKTARLRNLLVASAVVLVVLVLVAGCRRRTAAGAPCTSPGHTVCSSPTTALYCSGDKYVEMPCGGPKGCTGNMMSGICDDDIANAGDACVESAAGDNYACSKDRKSELVCKAGVFAAIRTCKGPTSCEIHTNKIYCDQSIADVSDGCRMESFACTPDHLTMLACESEKFSPRLSCRGPRQCWQDSSSKKIWCDNTAEQVGDVCYQEGHKTCSTDQKLLLECTNHQYTKFQTCPKDCVYPAGAAAAHCR